MTYPLNPTNPNPYSNPNPYYPPTAPGAGQPTPAEFRRSVTKTYTIAATIDLLLTVPAALYLSMPSLLVVVCVAVAVPAALLSVAANNVNARFGLTWLLAIVAVVGMFFGASITFGGAAFALARASRTPNQSNSSGQQVAGIIGAAIAGIAATLGVLTMVLFALGSASI